MTERRELHLTDPGVMRAMAHPTRLRILGQLRLNGPQTVGMLCERVDEPAGSVSYHIGTLAKHGLVEEVPELARDKRERWWKSTHTTTTWKTAELVTDPESRVALNAFRRTVLKAYQQSLGDYLESEETLPAEWVAAAAMGDTQFYLTADELAELRDEIVDVMHRWESRYREPGREGTEPVRVIYHAFRRPE